MGRKVDGRPLLERNPLTGLKRPNEKAKNVRRPVASHDRYVRTMAVIGKVDPEGRLGCMPTLARYTGRRENAICHLRTPNVLRTEVEVQAKLAGMGYDERNAKHLPHGGLYWRAETDKMGEHSVAPISRRVRGDAYLFAAPADPTRPFRRDIAGHWLMKAEQLAGGFRSSPEDDGTPIAGSGRRSDGREGASGVELTS